MIKIWVMIKIKIMTKIMIMTQGQRDIPAIIGHYCWQLSNDYGFGHCYWQRIKCFGIDHSGSLRWDLYFPQNLRFVSTVVPQKDAFFSFLLLTHWLLRLRPLVRSGPPWFRKIFTTCFKCLLLDLRNICLFNEGSDLNVFYKPLGIDFSCWMRQTCSLLLHLNTTFEVIKTARNISIVQTISNLQNVQSS